MEKLMTNKLDDMELDMVAGGRFKDGGIVVSPNSPVRALNKAVTKVVTAPFKKGVELTSKLFDKIREKVIPPQWG